jgi:hypothetical protein
MKDLQKYLSKGLLATAALLVGASPAWAQAPALGAASAFSVLAGTAVTCTDGVITGDVGVSPGTAFTNTRCTIAGRTPPATNAAARQARPAFLSAYTALQAQSRTCTTTLTSLDGLNLRPGVYCVDASAKTGTLTLTGSSTGVWIFLVNGALTGTNFSVVMDGGGQPCNVFWSPSAAATMTASAFKGNILAGGTGGSITVTGGTLAGRALANVAVTMTGASVIGCGALAAAVVCKDDDRDKDDKDDKKCDDGHDGNKGHGKCNDRDDDDKGHDADPRYPFGSKDK